MALIHHLWYKITMPDNMPIYSLPLDTRPQLRALGHPTHGIRAKKEKWLLANLWCIHLYEYHGELCLDGQWLTIEPGMASIIPPGTQMTYHYRGRSPHYYAHFYLPAASGKTRTAQSIPAIGPLGAMSIALIVSFEKTI